MNRKKEKTKKMVTLNLDQKHVDWLAQHKEESGVNVSEQVRRMVEEKMEEYYDMHLE